MNFPNIELFPYNTGISANGNLSIGGCDVSDLAREHGTPLYILDEVTLREKCREFVNTFRDYYPNTRVVYASKACGILTKKNPRQISLVTLRT